MSAIAAAAPAINWLLVFVAAAAQEYIRHLIFERLGDGSIVEVLKKLMKLPWPDCEEYLLKCLLKVGFGGCGWRHQVAHWADGYLVWL